MEAVLYRSIGDIASSQIAEPSPAANEILIHVRASGVCHTDIDILHGRYGNSTFPLVPGHEYAGEIVAIGDGVERFAIGDRVAVDPNIHCNNCRPCRKGLTNLCESLGAYGVSRNGGFAQYSTVDQDNAVAIGDLSYEVAALAEPVGCVLNGLDAIQTDSIENALIFGAGPIGLLMALSLRTRGIRDIAVVDLAEDRLALTESFGFKPLAAGSDELSGLNRSVDLVIDATGVPKVAEGLIDYTANGGRILLFGICPPGVNMALSPYDVFRRQIRIAGAHSLNHNIPKALTTIGRIGPDIARLISHRVPLSEIGGFLQEKGPRNTLKVQATTEALC